LLWARSPAVFEMRDKAKTSIPNEVRAKKCAAVLDKMRDKMRDKAKTRAKF
jgi:hypothetical protein